VCFISTLQEPVLFSCSIAENIAYGADNPSLVTAEQVERVAEVANATMFIRSFPQGFHTVVGEKGILLSGACCLFYLFLSVCVCSCHVAKGVCLKDLSTHFKSACYLRMKFSFLEFMQVALSLSELFVYGHSSFLSSQRCSQNYH
jgi:hypothetical protein